MKHDKLTQYAALRTSLHSEKADLESRLAEINQALGESTPVAKVSARATSPTAASLTPAKRGPGRRARNGTSLRDVTVGVLKAHKTLGRQDLLKAVVAAGYKFTAKDPLNSLSTLVYTNKKVFKAKSGQISLA